MYNIIQNPIPKTEMWATLSLAEVQEFIENLPRYDREQAYHVMMLTLNACNRLVETEILAKEVFAS
jgi:hypothetical protein